MDAPTEPIPSGTRGFNSAIWVGTIEERMYRDGERIVPMVAVAKPTCLLSAYKLPPLPEDFWLGLYEYKEFGGVRPAVGEVWAILAVRNAKGAWFLHDAMKVSAAGNRPQPTDTADSQARG